jgi:MFS family permease
MAKKYFFGFTGSKLRTAQMWAVIFPAYILFGYNQAVAGPLLDLPSWVKTFPSIDTADTTGAQQAENARVQGTVVAMYTLGCFFGALSCIYLGDRLGRIRMIQLGSAIHVIGAILESSSYSLAQMIVGRLVSKAPSHAFCH